jgi:hypothetical protein
MTSTDGTCCTLLQIIAEYVIGAVCMLVRASSEENTLPKIVAILANVRARFYVWSCFVTGLINYIHVCLRLLVRYLGYGAFWHRSSTCCCCCSLLRLRTKRRNRRTRQVQATLCMATRHLRGPRTTHTRYELHVLCSMWCTAAELHRGDAATCRWRGQRMMGLAEQAANGPIA